MTIRLFAWPRSCRWCVVAGTLLLILGALACGRPAAPPAGGQASSVPPATLTGSQSCASCHSDQYAQWQLSDHHEAMQVANSSTVKGDFGGARLTYNGVTSSFSSQGGRFTVRTDGSDGALADFPVAYTFGRRPLQQYLIQMPGGRYQALGLAWDARPKAEGGERWFHLYPNERVDHRDVLHWTRYSQNWNFTCAECHSTGLDKGYRADRDVYETTFAEINIGCEACHGPGSRHVAWAARDQATRTQDGSKGLVFSMKDTSGGTWSVPPGESIAKRSSPPSSSNELHTCARCHARRSQIWPEYRFGRPIDDTHQVALVDEGLYESNGLQRDEVFEYGSFVQSKMHAAGVTCSDCHRPHGGDLKFQGNALCTQCHVPARYDVVAHHRHRAGSAAAACAACHMPERTYMVVDGRRDHGFSIPRPDESVKYGTPNACTDCHRERTPAWAASAVAKWFGPAAATRPSYTPALHAGRAGWPEAGRMLSVVVADSKAPSIIRATALSMLPSTPTPDLAALATRATADPDPLVRRAAATATAGLDGAAAARISVPLLDDDVRAVRLEAVRVLAPAAGESPAPAWRARFDRVADELRTSLRFNADRAEARVTLGAFEATLGRVTEAETEYRAAVRMQPEFAPGHLNLADLLRATGRDTEAEATLRTALARVPTEGQAALQHGLGLALIRLKRYAEAVIALRLAAEAAPEDARFVFVYGVALHDTGQAPAARRVLADAARRHPSDASILDALVSYSLEAGDRAAARLWAERLAAAVPGNADVARRLDELKR